MPDAGWSIILHGGAKTIEPHEETSHRKAAEQAVKGGADILKSGGTALDAVEEAIKIMESGGVFNAGAGSVKRANGKVEMDASIMEGKNLAIGAVACIEKVEHPISVARSVLTETPVLIVGRHATEYARPKGFPEYEPQKFNTGQTSCDTVGCVARDKAGSFAVGLSTGGLSDAMPGRVGDAPLPGCGFYADDKIGGVCFSGEGETIARTMLAAQVMNRMQNTSVENSIEESLSLLQRVNGEAGCIALDNNGKPGWAHNSTHFAIAYQTSQDKNASIFLKKSESDV